MPSISSAFLGKTGKGILNPFAILIYGFKANNVKYQNIDSLNIAKSHRVKPTRAGCVSEELLYEKNEYVYGGIFYCLFVFTQS